MRLSIHAGHAPAGGIGCGAVGFLDESECARQIVAETMELLSNYGHVVTDVTVQCPMSANAVLKELVSRMECIDVDIHISVHLNASGDLSAHGYECYVWSKTGIAGEVGEKIGRNMENIGYRNRGVKEGRGLYVIRHTTAPCLLIECGFVTNRDDAALYDPKRIAAAIAHAVCAMSVDFPSNGDTVEGKYAVQIGMFKSRSNAEKFLENVRNSGFPDAYMKEV